MLGAQIRRTKRMPQDQGKLGHLFSLLAELQKGLLAGVLVEQVGDVGQGPAVILGDHLVLDTCFLMNGGQGIRVIRGIGDSVIVRLLSS